MVTPFLCYIDLVWAMTQGDSMGQEKATLKFDQVPVHRTFNICEHTVHVYLNLPFFSKISIKVTLRRFNMQLHLEYIYVGRKLFSMILVDAEY